VERSLNGKPFDKLRSTTVDGIQIEPLYTRAETATGADESGLPGAAPFTRGRQATAPDGGVWDIRSLVEVTDPAAANHVLLSELDGGVMSITLSCDGIRSADDLAAALDGVLLDVAPVILRPGARFSELSGWYLDLVNHRGVAVAGGSLGADPLGTLAATGEATPGLDEALQSLGRLAVDVDASPLTAALTTALVDTGVYAEAGCTPVQQLGAMAATVAAYLRCFVAAGLTPESAVEQVEVTLVLDAEIFNGIGLVRAARRALAALFGACGVDRIPRVNVRTAAWMMTAVDPWVNLLRVTTASFAGAVAGADSVTALGFDTACGVGDDFGRRLARNTQLLLALESHVGTVVDPAGGSWYLESLTEDLARAGWAEFQRIEAAGGMAAELQGGSFAAQVAAVRERTVAAIDTRRRPITGVTEFPLVSEAPVVRPPRAALAESVTDSATAAFPAWRAAADFEELRRSVEGRADRPKVFLANLGPLAVHTTRATWARNVFEIAGLDVRSSEPCSDAAAAAEAFGASGAAVACICSSDAVYGELAAATAQALRDAGAQRVLLAGRPGELIAELTAAGVDDFVAVGSDILALLTQLAGGSEEQR
jgi:methylmalonyl-CoA mutase